MTLSPTRASRRGFCLALSCAVAAVVGVLPATAKTRPNRRTPLPLHISGTRILDSRSRPVLLRGVNTASMEWSSDGEGHILKTVETAVTEWHANIIRLPLAQDRWFGKAPEQSDDGRAYRALVRQVVDEAAGHGAYVILDLHWSDAGEWGKQIGQHVMPDPNSVPFWRDVASAYKNEPAVLFDLYNEPHDVSWDVWRSGGTVTERVRGRREQAGAQKTYQAVGLQTLLDVVRSTGARNVAIAGGLDWSYDFSGILAGRELSDRTGNGVLYANHTYPFKGETVAQWIRRMETATKTLPVIVSEFGAQARRGPGSATMRRPGPPPEEWNREVLKVLHDHGWSWTAWDLHPSAGPCLISDWNYTPTPTFGTLVKQALLEPPPA